MRHRHLSRILKTAVLFISTLYLLTTSAAQAQSFRGHTCENLWEHIHTGGFVIFEEVNEWFYSNCTGRNTTRSNREKIQEAAHRPPVTTCPNLPSRVAVFGALEGTQCQMVGAAGIGRRDLIERGFLDAVDVWSYVNGGVEVCFRRAGTLVFLDATYLQRRLMDLASFARDGMTCGAIDRIGTVVLLEAAAPPAAAAPPTENTLPLFDHIPANDCQIKLTETLFLRATPGGEIIGLVWLNSEVPVFDVSGDWYKTEFEGVAGYISRFYSRVLRGGCI
jgi:hypothetical protein